MNKHDNFNNNIFFYDTFVGGTLILLAQSLKIYFKKIIAR